MAKNKKNKKKVNRDTLAADTPWKDNVQQAQGVLMNPGQEPKPKDGQPPKSRNRQSNDETRQRLANEREDRIAANKGKVTPIDELFLSTKGGRRAPPSGDYQHPTEKPLDWIKRNRTTGDALKAQEDAVPMPKIDVGATMANADAARQVQQMLAGQNGVRPNSQGTPIAYKDNQPVGFAGKAPSDIIADPNERSMANVKDLISNSERGKISAQVRAVAGAQPKPQPPAPAMAEGSIPPAYQSPGMPLEPDNAATPQIDESLISAFAPAGSIPQDNKALLGVVPGDVGQAMAAQPAPIVPGMFQMPQRNPDTLTIPDERTQTQANDMLQGAGGMNSPLAAFLSSPRDNMLNAGGDQSSMGQLVLGFQQAGTSYLPGNFDLFKQNRSGLEAGLNSGDVVKVPNPDYKYGDAATKLKEFFARRNRGTVGDPLTTAF